MEGYMGDTHSIWQNKCTNMTLTVTKNKTVYAFSPKTKKCPLVSSIDEQGEVKIFINKTTIFL